MPIDGAFLRHIKKELEENILGSRVDKIYQPSKYEIILNLRSIKSNFKLLLCSNSNFPRVHITKYSVENPQNPPMFCMLLRKKLTSAKLINIRQIGLERAVYFDFESKNELGDTVNLTLALEIMGKYSNIILIDNNNKIIEAIRRVDSDMSSKRLILPGLNYQYPPKQSKICILDTTNTLFLEEIMSEKSDVEVHKLLCSKIQGISSNIFNQVIKFNINKEDIKLSNISDEEKSKLLIGLRNLIDIIKKVAGKPCKIYNDSRQNYDVSFLNLGEDKSLIEYNSFSSLLDEFYYEKDRLERIKNKNNSLTKKVDRLIMRYRNKIESQKKELEDCSNKEIYKIYGDLLLSNIYKLKRGMTEIKLKNFYEKDNKEIIVKLDSRLDGSENVQKYYKKYKKLCNAEKVISDEITKSKNDINYLESILDFLSRAESDSVIEEMKIELEKEGYIKRNKSGNKIKVKPSSPDEHFSPEGFKILVGNNSKQNDMLTFKIAKKNDLWFHVKNVPGSHAVIITEGKIPSNDTILYAANLCALNSKARFSSNVAVDYTQISNVKKPSGAKPGMVNYFNYKTICITLNKLI